ncbi:MAG TPA: ABC transporter permease subunit [Xanthobacteraceae bacterium]|nr:ABC transporter permease subunit [Xanthobacteraceae bacterium]
MASESRKAPVQFGIRLRRILCGRAGWSGLVLQLVFAGLIIWLGYEIFANAKANLQNQRIASGFGFFQQTAGFGVSQSLIPYSESDTYLRVFFVGLINTLVVATVGIVFATILGFAVGVGRLSPNWLIARLSGGYVELVRNLPLLFQILFWYLAVLGALPGPRQSLSLFGQIFVNNRGLVIPRPIPHDGLTAFIAAIVLALAIALGLRSYARRRLFREGRLLTIWPYVLGLLIGLPVLSLVAFGTPFSLEMPQLRGFNFAGGLRIVPEFVALTLALSTYTAAFIAENVRAGIQSVQRGQTEAGASLGLSHGATLRLIVVPQAMRVILPPLTNQYLNLTKNSSLAVAIGYPDLFSVFAGTTLSQTGQAIEIIAITMGVYLLISLLTSALMGLYGWRLDRSLGR